MDDQDIEAMVEQSMLNDVILNNEDANISSFHDSGVGGHSGFLSSSNLMSPSDESFNRTASSLGANQTMDSTINHSPIKDIFYCQNYFDLDDILSQTIRLSVKFQRTVPKLGFLDPSLNQETTHIDSQKDIVKGTKLELPLWIVKELNGDNAVTVTVPKGYNQIHREILEADANCVNLHKLGPNFYLTGKHLTSMNLPESEDIAKILLDTFTQRFHRLVNFALSGSNNSSSDSSQSISSKMDSVIKSNIHNKSIQETKGSTSMKDDTINDLNQFVSRLDNWEKDLMETGRRIAAQIKRWENRDLIKVRPNEMVSNLKKRKILLEHHTQIEQPQQSQTSSNPLA